MEFTIKPCFKGRGGGGLRGGGCIKSGNVSFTQYHFHQQLVVGEVVVDTVRSRRWFAHGGGVGLKGGVKRAVCFRG